SVGDHGAQPFGVGAQLRDDVVNDRGAAVVDLDEDLVLLLQRPFDLCPQDLLIEQVGDANADAVHLVRIRGADPAPGRTDLALTQEAFGHLVQGAVVGGDHVRGGGDEQAGGIHPASVQPVDLLKQHFEVDDDAVSYHGCATGREDP